MSTGRLSRPSSAASHSSRLSHASYGSHASRTSPASHASGSGELKLECKAAYLSVFDDIREPISSVQDFVLVMQQAGRNPSQKIIRLYWDDDRGSMTFDDFVDVCRKVAPTSEDDLMKAFRKIDINGDGYISLDELCKIMTTKGERMSRDEVRMMIDEVDENKDGRLDYREFCRMFMSTTEECKKLSLRAMEKKERRKKRMTDTPTAAPRRERDDGSITGSQLSIRSAASEKTKPGLSTTAPTSGSLGYLSSLISSGNNNNTDDKRQSQASLRSDDLPRPSPRGTKMMPVIARLSEPNKLRDWYNAKSKGCFFVDEGKGFVSHQYRLILTEDTSLWITIQPTRTDAMRKLVDTAVYILSDDKDDDDAFVAFTEQRDSKGCCGVQCELTAGQYTLLPFTTGCRLKPRSHEPSKEAKLIVSDRDGKVKLSKPFVKALEEIFDMFDLDGNNLLSREEFSWFNIRTSEEGVADDEWRVVEENVELAAGEITKRGFVTLNEMEAEDNKGDTEDLWITLNSAGYNRALEMDEACPFLLNVFAEDGEAMLKITELENPGKSLENAVCASVIAKGEASKVKSMKDLTLYTYVGDARATIVVENKSRTKVTMEVDCSKSRNCVSNLGNGASKLLTQMSVPPMSKKVVAHFLPEDEKEEWSIRYTENILK